MTTRTDPTHTPGRGLNDKNRPRRTAVGLAVALVAGLLTVTSPTPLTAQNNTPEPEWLSYINAWRTAYGTQPIVENARLNAGAENHSCYVEQNQRSDWTAADYRSENRRLQVYTISPTAAANNPQGPYDRRSPLRRSLDNMLFASDLNEILGYQVVKAGFGTCYLGTRGTRESWLTLDTNSDRSPRQVWPANEDVMVFPPADTTINVWPSSTISKARDRVDPTLGCPNPAIRNADKTGIPIQLTFRDPVVAPVSVTYRSGRRTLPADDVCVLTGEYTGEDPTYRVVIYPRYTDTGPQKVTVTTGQMTVSWSFNVRRKVSGALPTGYTPPNITRVDQQIAPPPPPPAGWLDVVNAWRTAYGTEPIVKNRRLNRGARNHSCYVDRNRTSNWTRDDYYTENPQLPGYTATGLAAAGGPQGPFRPDLSLRLALESSFSALLDNSSIIFDPRIDNVGFGTCDTRSDRNGWFTFDTLLDRSPKPVWTADDDVMVFPPANTTWNFTNAPTTPNLNDPTSACQNRNIRLSENIGVPAIVTSRDQITGPITATYQSGGETLDDTDVCVLYHTNENWWPRSHHQVLVFPRYTNTGTQTVTVTTPQKTVSWSYNIPRARRGSDFSGAAGALPTGYTPPNITLKGTVKRPSSDGEKPEWLQLINAWRTAYGVKEIVEDENLNVGAIKHSCYVDHNRKRWWTRSDYRFERSNLPFSSRAGNAASGGPQTTTIVDEPLRPALERLLSTGVATSVLDPRLVSAGFGECDIDGDSTGYMTLNTVSSRWAGRMPWDATSGDVRVFPPAGVTWNFNVAAQAPDLDDPTLDCPNPDIRLANTIGVVAVATFRNPVVGPISATYQTGGDILTGDDICVLYQVPGSRISVYPRRSRPGTQTVTITTPQTTISWSFNIPRARQPDDYTGTFGELPTGHNPPTITATSEPPESPIVNPNSGQVQGGSGQGSGGGDGRTNFVAVEPFRFADSRDGQRLRASSLSAGGTQRIQVSGVGVLPAKVEAVSANFTVVKMGGQGFLTVFDCREPRPTVSTLNFVPGPPIANQAIVPLNDTGELCVYSNAATDFIIDINGYFTTAAGDRFTGVAPTRLYDTRPKSKNNPRDVGGRLAVRTPRVIEVTEANVGVPENATAVAVVAVAVDTKDIGWLRLYPCDQEEEPTGSNVNYRALDTRANAAIVKLSAQGTICAFSATDIELVVDVNGYFSESGSQFVPTAPYRRIDTRRDDIPTDKSPLEGGKSYSWNIFAGIDVPANTVGVSGNVTAVNMADSGFLTVWPDGDKPTASNVNVRPPNRTAAAGLVMPTDGQLFAYMSTSAHMILDINGYWVN